MLFIQGHAHSTSYLHSITFIPKQSVPSCPLTGKVGGNKEEGRPKEGEADAHSPFGFDLGDDPRCDCGMFHFCSQGKQELQLQYSA